MVWLTQCTVAEYHPCSSTLMTLDYLPWRKISYKLSSGKQISRHFWSASLKRSHKSLSSNSEPDSGSFCFLVPHHPSGVKFFRSHPSGVKPCLLSLTHPSVFLIHFCSTVLPCSWAHYAFLKVFSHMSGADGCQYMNFIVLFWPEVPIHL